MRMSYSVQQFRSRQVLLFLLFLAILLLTSACGGDAQIRQRATGSQARFARLLQHAEQIGIPVSMLQPVLQRQEQLTSTGAPFNPFDEQAINNYYSDLNHNYDRLTVQLDEVVSSGSEQLQVQARQDYELVRVALKHQEGQGLPAQNFLPQLKTVQVMLQQAASPKDYILVSSTSQSLLDTLQLLGTTSDQLTALRSIANLLRSANLNTDAAMAQTSYDLSAQLFSRVSSLQNLQDLNVHLNAQYQQASVKMVQAIEFIVPVKLNVLRKQVERLTAYHIKATAYQQRFTADRKLVHENMTLQDYQVFAARVDADTVAVKSALLRPEAEQLLKQFHQEAQSWGSTHAYHDNYDGKNYLLDVGYLSQGIGPDLDDAVAHAVSEQELQNAIRNVTDELFNLKMMELDSADSTPYDKMHSADKQLFDHYQIHNGQVIVISLAQQALRLYQDGKLVRAFRAVTGRPELPSPPGLWSVMSREAPTTFTSSEPRDSPYWYPPTHINYAILFRDGGYFIHDAWWRATFGPGNQFPHYDTSGDEADSGTGSHGCVNLPTSEAAWLYNNTGWDAKVIVF